MDVLDERTGAIDALTCIVPINHSTSLRKSLSNEGLVPNSFGPDDEKINHKMDESELNPRSVYLHIQQLQY